MGSKVSKDGIKEDDLDTLKWDSKETVLKLIGEIIKVAGYREKNQEPKLKIILIGPTGAGKSSLINCFLSVLKGKGINVAISGSRDHVTEYLKEYPLYSEDGALLDVAFYDCKGMGIQNGGEIQNDILNAVFGYKKLGEPFSPNAKDPTTAPTSTLSQKAAHVILYLINGNQYNEKIRQKESNIFSDVLELKGKTDKYGISRFLLVTFMDKLDEKLSDDIRHIYNKSKQVKKCIGSVQQETKFPNGYIIPIANKGGITEPTIEYRVYYLYLLKLIINDANDIYEQRQYDRGAENRKDRQVPLPPASNRH